MKGSPPNSGLTRLTLLATFVAAAPMAPIFGQSPTARPVAFEVASIRPAAMQRTGGEGNSRSQIEYAADSLTMRNIDLNEMVEWAYGLEHYQLLGPNKLEGQRFDIRARAVDRESVSTLRLMLQDLLAARFKLQLHREEKSASVYELVIAKGGPRLPKNKADTVPSSFPRESLPRVVDGSFVFSNVSIAEFAHQLTELRGIELPVLDRTGIEGVYDITLKSAANAILESDGPSLFTLIQEQLGLKLVSAKDPVEVVIVDHAESPSAN